MKKIIMIMLTLMLTISMTACGEERNPSNLENRKEESSTQNVGHYYSVEEARTSISSQYGKFSRFGFTLGNYEEIYRDEEGEFSCVIGIEPEEYTYLSISGCVEFSISYSDKSNDWNDPQIELEINYDWHIPTGQWYAETRSKNRWSGETCNPYYVYLDIMDFDGEKLHAILEAKWDSIEGGIGSYDPQEQTITMRTNYHLDNPVITFPLSGGYPSFELCITKDSMTIYENNNEDMAVELQAR